MDTWEIVLLVVVGVLVLLFVGGLAGNARMRARGEASLDEKIAAADHALAAARAEDRGWDPALLEAAARAAFAARHPASRHRRSTSSRSSTGRAPTTTAR